MYQGEIDFAAPDPAAIKPTALLTHCLELPKFARPQWDTSAGELSVFGNLINLLHCWYVCSKLSHGW
jgi:hypothetical protein